MTLCPKRGEQSIVPATPGVTNGTAATREEAMAKFRAAWEKVKPGTLKEHRKSDNVG